MFSKLALETGKGVPKNIPKMSLFCPLYKYLQVYNANKQELDLVFQKGSVLEGFCGGNYPVPGQGMQQGEMPRAPVINNDEKLFLGMTAGIFMFVLLLQLVIFIAAIVLLVKNWDRLSLVAQIFGIVFIFWMPIITIIIALFLRTKGHAFL
jgi:hypothetical protein